jgi:hypothetical protein
MRQKMRLIRLNALIPVESRRLSAGNAIAAGI